MMSLTLPPRTVSQPVENGQYLNGFCGLAWTELTFPTNVNAKLA